MESVTQSKTTFREKATDELREFAIIAGYLYVCFAAIFYLKAAVLQAPDVAYAPLGLAAIKAAICAKFMLLGRAFHIGERFKTHPLIFLTLHKSFAFLALLIALSVIEEAVIGVVHGRTILESVAGIAGGTFHQMVATSLILLLILIPYFAFRSLGDVIGDRTLVRLYFEPRGRIDEHHDADHGLSRNAHAGQR
jgi:hypothetical protein